MLIRHADPIHDAGACAAIYAPFVLSTPISFEEDPPGEAEMARRIERVSATHQWLVAELDGALAGYAYASRHHERAAYRWATNVPCTSTPHSIVAASAERCTARCCACSHARAFAWRAPGSPFPTGQASACTNRLGSRRRRLSADRVQARLLVGRGLVAVAACRAGSGPPPEPGAPVSLTDTS